MEPLGTWEERTAGLRIEIITDRSHRPGGRSSGGHRFLQSAARGRGQGVEAGRPAQSLAGCDSAQITSLNLWVLVC